MKKISIFFPWPLGAEPKKTTFAPGEMAERSNAAVLKTVEGHTSGGSNPSLSAKANCKRVFFKTRFFFTSQ